MMGGREFESRGIIPRLTEDLFTRLHESCSEAEKGESGQSLDKTSVEVSFLEIYNEKVQDLLNPNNKNYLKVSANYLLLLLELFELIEILSKLYQ